MSDSNHRGELDPIDELKQLVVGFRRHLESRVRSGDYSAPGAALAPPAPALEAGVPQAANAGGIRPTLPEIRQQLGECTRCKLADGRNKIVFGVGSAAAPLLFVGEAPGAEEDRTGEPFVGRAGQLLDRMIVAMGWSRDTVYIANVLKCRPPGNRDPEPDEVEACEPFLARQIEALAPRIIVTLGKPAAHLLLKTRAPISALRGRFQEFRGVKVMPTFHPAFLLRQPERKGETWSDLKKVMAELDRLGIAAPNPPRG